ncbi:MAG TPA: acyl-CoA thioester hydrolase/BAAT C-terminal domain-containing protein [Candidatus Binatia bacterium]|nr:acyl-CoA thioester hydrolase/BAAT C-terminal domain-containing protein [Candidatus Binatia bacterium]
MSLVGRRFAALGFPHPVEHRSYLQAGHMIGPAGMPAAVDAILHPLRGIQLALGGTPAGNSAAAADSWPRVLEFLGAALGPGR